uniref:Uncharacterized protein n=1 Tax=Caudovirales sp. cts2v4 TaxID=2825773 RepID=A0A8S5PLL2_9CAUD|nr:MAG TPA: hypothetical protein [Caudovirales sp. cts2v4]DAT20910.1 MAG TPA: hypothetical protein [Caudoviricetes sp.]
MRNIILKRRDFFIAPNNFEGTYLPKELVPL